MPVIKIKVLFLFVVLIIVASCREQTVNTTKAILPIQAVALSADSIPLPQPDSLVSINAEPVKIKLYETAVILNNGDSFTLRIPVDYKISVAAQGLKRLRFLAISPDNRLFATDMYDRSDNRRGRVLIFDRWNDVSKQYDSVITFMSRLHNPNQIAFHDSFIYVAETHRLTRFSYNAGSSKPADTGQVIMTFPDYGLSYKYGGWHLTRSIAFHGNKLYVSIGSSCNACIESEKIRASILEMNPDGSDVKWYARGIRNAVGLNWIGNELWATNMGRDLLGPDTPEDVFQQIERDSFYGWPYYFQYRGAIAEDEQFKDSAKPAGLPKPPVSPFSLKAHSAPLGFAYFSHFSDSILNHAVLVCLHGSTSVWRQRGNSVVRVAKGGRHEEVVTGFLSGKTEAGRHGRPCDVLMFDNRSFFITDDLQGVLYYIWKNE